MLTLLTHPIQVWFAHKKVCGKNSLPFALPLLSKKEADDIKTWLPRLFFDPEQPGKRLSNCFPVSDPVVRFSSFFFSPIPELTPPPRSAHSRQSHGRLS
jgi:hypothetical protein